VTERIPAAYLTNEAWLGEFRFYVDPRVIVPRSHIADVLEHLDNWMAGPDNVKAALDLCTGSGCLAILLAHAFPGARVDAIDISLDALEVAKRNVADYGFDLGTSAAVGLVRGGERSALRRHRQQSTVRHYGADERAACRVSPRAGARVGGRGRRARCRAQNRTRCKRHLQRGGVLIVEVGDGRAAVEDALPDLPFTWLETGGGNDRVFLLERAQLPG
jgi:ribosomal protein L3 glutamine methyltransferase